MKIIPPPFEIPIQIGNLDCLVTVRIDSYMPAGGDGWDEPRHDAEVEFTVESVRQDRDGSRPHAVSAAVSTLLELSDDLHQACLDAIEEANQPPED